MNKTDIDKTTHKMALHLFSCIIFLSLSFRRAVVPTLLRCLVKSSSYQSLQLAANAQRLYGITDVVLLLKKRKKVGPGLALLLEKRRQEID